MLQGQNGDWKPEHCRMVLCSADSMMPPLLFCWILDRYFESCRSTRDKIFPMKLKKGNKSKYLISSWMYRALMILSPKRYVDGLLMMIVSDLDFQLSPSLTTVEWVIYGPLSTETTQIQWSQSQFIASTWRLLIGHQRFLDIRNCSGLMEHIRKVVWEWKMRMNSQKVKDYRLKREWKKTEKDWEWQDGDGTRKCWRITLWLRRQSLLAYSWALLMCWASHLSKPRTF